MEDTPEGLPFCNPNARCYPLAWKEAYFRRHRNSQVDGYICPICSKVFRAPRGFQELRADHIHPFGRGGLTTWENLQLLCLKCNAKKSDKLPC